MPKKRVVAHPTRSRGIMQHMYFDFIIGEDSEGKERRYTCNPNELGNSVFGKNVGAPQFLTAVYFKTAVLDKYLDSPSRYDVEAGCLRCKGVNGADWCIPIDNHGTRCVSVWLGDLGGLPYDEQLHFASYNVARGTMSEIYLRSQIDAEFCDSNNIIQIFKAEYRKLYDTYADQLEWVVILPLAEADRHCLNSLKLLTCDEQKEFDEQILSLTKVLVDSINEKKLKDYGCVVKANGGINLLEAVVEFVGMIGYERHIKFLRNLQDLRSACVAHRKGSRYEQIASRVGLNVKTKTKVFCEMIEGDENTALAKELITATDNEVVLKEFVNTPGCLKEEVLPYIKAAVRKISDEKFLVRNVLGEASLFKDDQEFLLEVVNKVKDPAIQEKLGDSVRAKYSKDMNERRSAFARIFERDVRQASESNDTNDETMQQLQRGIEKKVKQEIEKTYTASLDKQMDIYRLSEVAFRKKFKTWKDVEVDGKVPLTASSIRNLDVSIDRLITERTSASKQY